MRRRRIFIHGTNAIVLTLLILGILAVINYLSWKVGSKIDVTREKLHSVSDQTIKVLNGIDNDIDVLASFKDVGLDRLEFQELIDEYTGRSNRIKFRFVDADKEPGVARKYEIDEYGTVVLSSGDREIKVKVSDPISGNIKNDAEQQLTNALIKLSSDKKKGVYFLVGHGERDINNNSDAGGLGKLKRTLEEEGYEVGELLLLRESIIPSKNSILIIASPAKPLSEKELGDIKKYLDEGGRAVFLIEPRMGGDLVSLLKDYGIEVENDIVIDPSSKMVGGGDVAPIVAQYPNHGITDNFRLATIFPFSRSINVTSKDNVTNKLIANTSQFSWSERNLSLFDQGTAQQDDGDKPGPLGVAEVSEIGEKSKVAVFGSADFVSNRFFGFSGNSDLFLNTVHWIVGDENLISIRPKVAEGGKLTITQNQLTVIFMITVVLLPAIVLFTGVGVWLKRRNM
jgi:gliding motility-associatede transport system auxiliary component